MPISFPLFAPLPLHFIFEVLAYAIGFQFYKLLRRKTSDDYGDEARLYVLAGAIVGAAFGSKLIGALEHPELFRDLSKLIFLILSAKSILGGLVGGTIGVEIVKYFAKIKRSSGDIYVFPLIIGMIIGRFGCFAQGVSDGTWGKATSSILGIDGGDGILRHPTPLYEIVALCLIALFIKLISKYRGLIEGDLYKVFLFLYCLWRLCIEAFKPVQTYSPLQLSVIQIVSVFVMVYYLTIALRRIGNKIANP